LLSVGVVFFPVKTKGLKRGLGNSHSDSLSDRIKRRKRSGANDDEDYSDDSGADYAEEREFEFIFCLRLF